MPMQIISHCYPKKHLGQHFLHSARVLQQIVQFINPQSGENLVEIGPGLGALTTKLLQFVSHLDVIEIDLDVIPKLLENCKGLGEIVVHQADVLRFDFTKLSVPIRLVGNLPYNISTPLLFHIIENITVIEDMHFLLQKEVAERLVAASGSKIYGRLSVMLQYHCDVKLLLHVGPGAFSPPPKVDSALIRLVPKQQYAVQAIDTKLLSEVVRLAFGQRRKIIRNSLQPLITQEQLEDININPLLRPEQLSVDDFVVIANAIGYI